MNKPKIKRPRKTNTVKFNNAYNKALKLLDKDFTASETTKHLLRYFSAQMAHLLMQIPLKELTPEYENGYWTPETIRRIGVSK